MVHSMTAFARVERAGAQGTLSWELRSVNHRYLEPHLRLPESFRDLEGAIREALRQGLSRGKVECTLRFVEETAGKLDFAGLQAGYTQFFGTPEQPLKPARTALQVVALPLPGALIEVEAIAARPA
ncbi:hypothetical protein ALP24_03684 [Pseudomonas syringae pv. aptata]|uniref:Endoribonuclease YicC-like N-terminal domain-containing protein n=1 Tax=Pseudomonas syringae pv. aptata TaxID=83167 RepID=A0A3M5WVB7_PSEAP|nr:hypothetical protein ALP24_03684 [Pseudomonas syringae pv. aptata]